MIILLKIPLINNDENDHIDMNFTAQIDHIDQIDINDENAIIDKPLLTVR